MNEENVLLLNGEKVGKILEIEKDTCDATYMRRNRTELTLNSNMRSQCKGCTFCGTYNLEPEDRIDMSTEEMIEEFICGFLQKEKIFDMSSFVRVTICTGCFKDEMSLVKHILSIYKIFGKFGFSKKIRYIGSQIQSERAMSIIEKEIPNFSLSLTVECFNNRELRMRKEKAELTMEKIEDILSRSLAHGFATNYLYILGLDDFVTLREGIFKLSNMVNRMPIYQIMQNYSEEHERQRSLEAKDIEYYLKARKLIELTHRDGDFIPRSWENYRGLFYTTYQNKYLDCIRI